MIPCFSTIRPAGHISTKGLQHKAILDNSQGKKWHGSNLDK